MYRMANRLIYSDPEFVTRLINEVESRPCLWDVGHPYYHNRKKMDAAWQEISGKIDFPVNTVRLNWKTLRHMFKNMVRMGNIKDIQEYKGDWPHFKRMWFINKQIAQGNRADSSEEAFSRSIPNSSEEAMPRSIPDSCEEVMPRNIPDSWEKTRPRSILDSWEEAMPRNIANSWEEAMTESIPDSWEEAMTGSIPDSWEEAMPRGIPDSWEEAMTRSIPDNWEEAMPRNVANSWEEAMAKSITDSGEEVATEGGEVVLKCKPVLMKHEEMSLSVLSNLTPAKSSEEDYDVMFLSSLTPFFKKLEPIRRLRVRNKIQELLIHELNDQTNSNIRLDN